MTGKDLMRKKLGANIQKRRNCCGLTQQQLADMTGFSRSYIAEVETGKRNVSINNLFRISQGLEIEISELTLGIG